MLLTTQACRHKAIRKGRAPAKHSHLVMLLVSKNTVQQGCFASSKKATEHCYWQRFAEPCNNGCASSATQHTCAALL